MSEMDALTDFTAMSPPRGDGGGSDGETHRRRSLEEPSPSMDESFSTSQYSADPSAFMNFQAAHTRLPSSVVPPNGGVRRMRLAIGSKAATDACKPPTPSPRGREDSKSFDGSHLSELFSADTQDEEGCDDGAGLSLSGKRSPSRSAIGSAKDATARRNPQPGQREFSTSSSALLFGPESAWLQRKRSKQPVDNAEAIVTGLTDESHSSPSPRVKTATPPQENEAPSIGSGRRTLILGSSERSEDFTQFELNVSRSRSLPPQKPAAGKHSSKEAVAAQVLGVITKQGHTDLSNERTSDDDEATSTEGFNSRGAASKVPIRNSARPVQAASYKSPQVDTLSETGTEPYVPSDDGKDSEEETEVFPRPDAYEYSLEDDEDDENYTPTQPSKAFYSQPRPTPVEEEPPIVIPPMVALGEHGEAVCTDESTLIALQDHSYDSTDSKYSRTSSASQCDTAKPTGTKSSTAIRNLEFSFTIPESQDSASLQEETVSVIHQVALRLETRSIKKTTAADVDASLEPTPKKAKKAQSPVASTPQTSARESSQQSTGATPHRKRKRESTSRGSTQDDAETGDTRATASEVTPSRPLRRSTKRSANGSTSSTPPSSQKARTRPKELSPLPSTRPYASRSRTIFKFKFMFVVTGFSKKGEASMTELIQEHGGKLAEREQDVLLPGNSNAVVIATPVAWRKLKFMQAVACGIPVVHPEWIHRCIKAASVLPFDGYTVPSGYSISTRKFECYPVKQLNVFSGYTFGIATDVNNHSAQPKEMVQLVAMTLKACGAREVHENLTPGKDVKVDIVLCNEYTKICKHYARKLKVPVKNFSWVTECVVLQEFLEPSECDFEPPRKEQDAVLWANAVIGDLESSSLKLHVGELILADLSRNQIDHFLLFHVCEILDMFLIRDSPQTGGSGTRRRRTDDGPRVMLRVAVLKRSPYSAGLSRKYSRVLEIPSTQVKRRVVAVCKTDFDTLRYRDESIFFMEDEDESAASSLTKANKEV